MLVSWLATDEVATGTTNHWKLGENLPESDRIPSPFHEENYDLLQ